MISMVAVGPIEIINPCIWVNIYPLIVLPVNVPINSVAVCPDTEASLFTKAIPLASVTKALGPRVATVNLVPPGRYVPSDIHAVPSHVGTNTAGGNLYESPAMVTVFQPANGSTGVGVGASDVDFGTIVPPPGKNGRK